MSSWKEIAAYLGVSVRTAQLWERQRGLPVKRLPGGRGVVSAWPADLDAWRNSGDMPAVEVPSGEPESAEPDPADPEQEQIGPEPESSPAHRPRSSRLRKLALAVAAIILLAGAGLFAHNSPVADVHLEGQWLSFADSEGREIWARHIPRPTFFHRALAGSHASIRAFIAHVLFSFTESAKPATVTLTGDSAVVAALQGAGSLQIKADGPWRAATSDPSWLTVSPSQGEGDTILTFTWTANTLPAGRIAAVSVNGAVFGVAQLSSSGQYTPWPSAGYGRIITLAGDGKPGFAGDGGVAASAQLRYPTGIAVDANANVYFSDFRNFRLRRIRSLDRIISTVAGRGANGFSGDGGPALSALLSSPYHLTLDALGNAVFADSDNSRVRRVDTRTGIISTIAGGGGSSPGDGGQASLAKLEYPVTGVALDPAGNLFLSEWYVERIRRVDPSGVIRQLPRVDSPNALATDRLGRLYIASNHGHRIIRMDPSTGRLETIAGTGSPRAPVNGRPATRSPINGPHSIAIRPDMTVYFTDDSRVNRIDAQTGAIQTIAGNGSAVFSGDGGPAVDAGVNAFAVALDVVGNVYVSDYENHRVRFIDYVTGRPLLPSAPAAVKARLGTQLVGESTNYAGYVTWTAPAGEVSGYRLHRYVKSSSRCILDPAYSATAPPGDSSFTDTAAGPDVCGYAVASVSEGGVSSYQIAWIGRDYSVEVTAPISPAKVNAVMTPDPARGKGVRDARITWIDMAMNEDTVLVRRFAVRGMDCMPDPEFGIVKLPANSLAYTDTNVPPAVCGYQASMSNRAGSSRWMGDRDLGPDIVQLLTNQ